MKNLESFTLEGISNALARGQINSTELVQNCIDRIKLSEPRINALINWNESEVIEQAAIADKRRSAGEALGPFDGTPIVVKDNIAVAGQTCSCASKLLENLVSPYDATVVKRLKEQGFIILARANMDEFAMGSSCENSAFGSTANPWDTDRVPGGSSGGSAAAVAAQETPVALGSDTGGSIRQPASFCGVVGLKPTYGRISRSGLVAFASSLDQIGPITQTVKDAAILMDILGGHDANDSTSLPNDCSGFSKALDNSPNDLKGVRIGLPREYFDAAGIEPGVEKAIKTSIDLLKSLGAECLEVSLPHTKYAVSTYYIIATAEASANLARFDGIRYGNRTMDSKDLLATYFQSRGRGFGDEVKRRIMLGTYVLSSGYYDAYYLRAQKVRTLIREDFKKAFQSCDAILTPVSPTVAFKFGEKSDPLQMYLADIFTLALNLAGNCGISVPAALDDSTGMPIGTQFIAPDLEEAKLLRISRTFELNRELKTFAPQL